MLFGGGCLILLLFYFLGERILLRVKIGRIPLRICVTGTRGKSTVTRLIASSLREAGFQVLAKTTGSRPVIIFPDGEEREIERRGLPSILEGKRILKLASKLKAQAFVAEMMSIQPECSFVESRQLLAPQILVITNVRLDHLDLMGSTKEEIAQSLSASIPPQGKVFVPQEEYFSVFEEAAQKIKAKIIPVKRPSDEDSLALKAAFADEFEENVRLALAVTQFLGIKKEVVFRGMAKARPDFGSLKIFVTPVGLTPCPWYLVSAFAANDPESTARVLSKLKERISFAGKRIIGILNFREDRGDRTGQWIKAFEDGFFHDFQRLVFIGAHSQAICRKKKFKFSPQIEVSAISAKNPKKIMERLSAMEREEVILIGMGNMGGLGRALLEYWEEIGKPYGN